MLSQLVIFAGRRCGSSAAQLVNGSAAAGFTLFEVPSVLGPPLLLASAVATIAQLERHEDNHAPFACHKGGGGGWHPQRSRVTG